MSHLTKGLSNDFILESSDGCYSLEKIKLLLNSSKLRIVIFRISHLSSLLNEYRSLIDLIKEKDKILFVISLSDTGGYLNDNESKSALEEYPVAFGEDITVGAACGKCASLLGRGLSNAEIIPLLSQNMRGELTLFKPKTLFRTTNFNFIDELVEYVSQRTGEDMEFTKKGIVNLLEHEIVDTKCWNILGDLRRKVETAYKNNSYNRSSVLHFLCRVGDLERVQRLIELQVDFDVLDINGMSPAFVALQAKHVEVTRALFLANFKPKAPVKYIMKLYEEALKKDQVKVFEVLFHFGFDDFNKYLTFDGKTFAHLVA